MPTAFCRMDFWDRQIKLGSSRQAGISAPVSITFLNAIKLSRSGFIAVVSMFFVAMSLVQMPMLVHYELLTLELAGYGVIGRG